MKTALEALCELEHDTFHPAKVFKHKPAITALRLAIEQGRQMGDAYGADTREQAIFLLGLQYGRYPQAFARPLGELLEE